MTPSIKVASLTFPRLFIDGQQGKKWRTAVKFYELTELAEADLRLLNGQCSCRETTKWLEVDIFLKLLRVSHRLLVK